jgi:hypothetical protein
LIHLSAGWVPVAISGFNTCSCMANPPAKEPLRAALLCSL